VIVQRALDALVIEYHPRVERRRHAHHGRHVPRQLEQRIWIAAGLIREEVDHGFEILGWK